jgi:ankyrin repeat protein
MTDEKRELTTANLDTALLGAVWRGDLAEVQALLERGADARARDAESGLTALMIAAGSGKADLVQSLLVKGADVFAMDSQAGASALHKACQAGNLDVVKLLVEHGAHVDAVVPVTGHTALTEAIWFAYPDIVEYLLDRDVRLSIPTHYGFTLEQHYQYELNVNVAARERVLAIGELLSRRRAADQQAVETQTLLSAVIADDLDEVRRLLAAGADVEARAPMLGSFNDAHTPLLVAARDGHTAIVAELLGAGADVNAMEPTFMAVPLHKAVYNGHTEITRLLAEHPGVKLDVQGATNGYTPLHDALWHGYAECAEILVAAGARLDLLGHDGKTPLDLATEALGADHPLTRRIEAGARES